MSKLAILGGTPAVSAVDPTIFKWPIVTPEMESAVLKVLHDGSMSGTASPGPGDEPICPSITY